MLQYNYACIHCHNENEKHEVVVWNKAEQNTKAILCGNFNFEMTIILNRKINIT
jgi:uncharacterized CHY-type Zn-finger protein